MNFSPEITTGTAVFLSLFAAFMWGTWFIALKYLKDYPVDGFYMTLFTTSIIFVWALGFFLDGNALISSIRAVLVSNPSVVYVTLTCGVLYIIGIRVSLIALQKIGLSLSQPIQASFNILIGTLISGLVGGIPEGVSLTGIVFACLLLFAAVFATLAAGELRSRELNSGADRVGLDLHYSSRDILRSTMLLVLASALIQTYTFALSYGLRTISNPRGLPLMPFMTLLCSGAYIGTLCSSGLVLTFRRQWHCIFHAPLKTHLLGIGAGLCHYGGNIIHSIGTTALSTVISWPLGVTMGLWTQFWGIVYGEFRNASRRTAMLLSLGIALYLIGAYLISIQVR